MDKNTYIVATTKPWNIQAFHDHVPALTGKWVLIDDRAQLTPAFIKQHKPRYIFFPHWSWKVGPDILDAAECVCFHMTAVPYGRGGSPLQNLIQRGHTETTLTALRMEEGLDTGPVYLQRPLQLYGSAQDIFERTALSVWNMIDEIVKTAPTPIPQHGEPVLFDRRTPDQSVLPSTDDLAVLYDHIRMLDAKDYPHAFATLGPLRLEFTNARLADGRLSATVSITGQKNGEAT